jgi:hypothetical protein
VTHPNGGWVETLTFPDDAPKRTWVENDDWNPFLDESPAPEGGDSAQRADLPRIDDEG